MSRAVNLIEIFSYGLIILIGLRLLWVKGRAFVAELGRRHRPAAVGAAVTPAHLHYGAHAGDHDRARCEHDHHHGDHSSACGHVHAPEPEQLAGPGGWTRGLSAIAAVGLRPCSGAILVLVFALAQGLFWAGVTATFIMAVGTGLTVATIATVAVGAKAWAGRFAATRSGYGTLAVRAIEVGAAALIIAFGTLLLTGYMVSERMIGV
jgi:nickel/cobalt exporter